MNTVTQLSPLSASPDCLFTPAGQLELFHSDTSGHEAPLKVAKRNTATVLWVPLEADAFNPCANYPRLVVGGVALNAYLSSKIDWAIHRWSRLEDTQASQPEVVRIKHTVIRDCVHAFRCVSYREQLPDEHLLALSLVTNAIRSLTVLANYLVDWQLQPKTTTPSTDGSNSGPLFEMSRYYAGFLVYSKAMLPADMMPLGEGRICPIKRMVTAKKNSDGEKPTRRSRHETIPDGALDGRCLANVFATSPDVVETFERDLWGRLRSILRPLREEAEAA